MTSRAASTWRQLPLSETCMINPKKSDLRMSDRQLPVSFVPMVAVDERCGTIVNSETRLLSQVEKGFTCFREGDVLFAKITPCMENGKTAIARGLVNGVGFGSTEFHVFRPRDGILPEWVFYFLRSKSLRTEAATRMTGSAGQQRVPLSFLQEITLPVPPLEAQHHAIEILEDADAARRARTKSTERFSQLIQTIFHEMYGDPSHTGYWPSRRLDDLLLQSTTRNPCDTPLAHFKYVDIGSVDASVGKIVKPRTMLGKDAPSRARKVVRGKDVIVSMTRPNLNATALVQQELDGHICSTGFCVLRCGTDLIPEFLHAFTRTAYFVTFLVRRMQGASYPAVRERDVLDMTIPVPSLAKQRHFAAIYQDVDTIQNIQSEELRKLDQLFESLLETTFAGRRCNQ